MKKACMRCGTMDHCEYGTDGLPYCQSCIFYGLNQQCWNCRMYLPASELQNYRGQWMCPYCVQDKRSEDVRKESSAAKGQKPVVRKHTIEEDCERCGGAIGHTAHILNGRRLCKRCLEAEKDKWVLVGGGPSGTPYAIKLDPQGAKSRSLLSRIIDGFLLFFGLRKARPAQVLVYEEQSSRRQRRPMSEGMMEQGPPQRPPKSEGLLKGGHGAVERKPDKVASGGKRSRNSGRKSGSKAKKE